MRLAHRLLFVVPLLLLAASRAHAQSPLRLNEFLAGPARDWDGSGTLSTRDDEWIEVMNVGGTPLDLSGYLLTDGDKLPRFAFTGTLAPSSMRVVYGKESVDWERATGNPVFGLSLANTGDSVMLWQVVGPDTLLVDSYTYQSHEAAADRAVGRTPESAAWALEDGLDPYGGTTPPTGTGCLPSPGTANLCGVTPTLKASWGKLKTLYR